MRNYLTIDNSLHSTAEATIKFLSSNFGFRNIKVEEPIHEYQDYTPTLNCISKDFYIICIDVAYKIYNPSRWNFVTDCEKLSLPIKFFVAIPKGTNYNGYLDEIKSAKKHGIGVIEVDPSNYKGEILNNALSLSLTSLRNFNKEIFPLKYRQSIADAEETFKNGEPNKACSIIYDEIEGLSRRIAIKTHTAGYWKQQLTNPSELQKCQWSNVIDKLKSNLDRKTNSNCQQLSNALLSQIAGITSHRNQSGHKPANRKELIKRDTQLRTRLESSIDLLTDLIAASKSLRV